MPNELAALSSELASVVARAAQSVVAIHARPRFPSSGVFWRPGIVVTAEHTVRRDEEINVTLPDGSNATATLAGSDAGTDLAVLKLDAPKVAPLRAAGTTPSAGNIILCIGRSPDSGDNATMGIVSAVSGSWRTWRGGRLDHYIRLDLTLYPNSAGGAVVNVDGELIGIATPSLSRIAGVAIPTATIDRVINEILQRGHVARSYLGVGLQPVQLTDHQTGLIVVSLESKGPAAGAGVLIGDILLSLAGQPVSDTGDLQSILESHGVGSTVEADFLRGGEAKKLAIKIGERPRRD